MEFAPNQLELTISVLFGEPDQVLNSLANDVPRVEPQRRWSISRGEFSLDSAFIGSPPPGSAHSLKVVAFSLGEAGPVVMTANIQDGWNSLAFRSTVATGSMALVLTFSSEVGVDYPARGFSVYKAGTEIRAVRAYRDTDNWCFAQSGSPLPSEVTLHHAARLIKNRVMNSHLVDLAVAMGVPLNEGPLRGYGVLLVENDARNE
jgi:hypothetical protein